MSVFLLWKVGANNCNRLRMATVLFQIQEFGAFHVTHVYYKTLSHCYDSNHFRTGGKIFLHSWLSAVEDHITIQTKTHVGRYGFGNIKDFPSALLLASIGGGETHWCINASEYSSP